MPLVSPSPGGNSGQTKTTASKAVGKISGSGISSAIKKVSGEREEASKANEQSDKGNTKEGASTTTYGESADQAAARAVDSRFQTSPTSAYSQYGAGINSAALGAGALGAGGLGGAAGALASGAGALGGAVANAWKGLGALGGGGSGGGGGGCGGGGCGGGGDIGEGGGPGAGGVNRSQNPNASEMTAAQKVKTLEQNLENGGYSESSPLHNIAKQVIASDKPMLLKVSATWCGPCQEMKPTDAKLAQNSNFTFKNLEQSERQATPENKALLEAVGSSGFPTYIKAYRDAETGKVKFELADKKNLASSMDGVKHASQEQVLASLEQAKQSQSKEAEAKVKLTEKGKELFGTDSSTQQARDTFADMQQKVGKKDGKDISFFQTLKKGETSYFAKTNADGSRSLAKPGRDGKPPKGFSESDKVSFADLTMPDGSKLKGKDGKAATKEDFLSATHELNEKSKAKKAEEAKKEPEENKAEAETKPQTGSPATTTVGLCAGQQCESYEINFKAKDLNQEIKKFADAVQSKNQENNPSPNDTGLAIINPTSTNPEDQAMIGRLNELSGSDQTREAKEEQFRSEVDKYSDRHDPTKEPESED